MQMNKRSKGRYLLFCHFPLLTPLFTGSSQKLITQVQTRPKDATSGFIDFRSVCYFLSFNSRYFPHFSIYIFSTVYILPFINHLNLRVVSFHFFRNFYIQHSLPQPKFFYLYPSVDWKEFLYTFIKWFISLYTSHLHS